MTGAGAGREADIAIWGRVPPPIGGMAVHVERLLPYLERAGLSVRMYNLQRPGPAHPLVAEVSHRRLAWFLRLLLGRGEPVHYVLGGRAVTRFAAGLLAALRGKRIVLRVGGESLRRTGLEGGPLERWATRFAVRRAAAVIGVNEEICALARGLGARPERVHRIPGFIPPPETGESAPELVRLFAARRRPLLVSGGQVAEPGQRDLYGVMQLLDLMPRLLASFPRAGLVFFAYQVRPRGDAPHEPLAAEVRRRGLGESILVHPSEGQFWPVLALADLMVRPTLTDGDSNALREALYLGVPVVASDCAPRPAGTHLYRAGNAVELAEVVTRVLSARADQAPPAGAPATDAPAARPPAADARAAHENADRVVALLQSLVREAAPLR